MNNIEQQTGNGSSGKMNGKNGHDPDVVVLGAGLGGLAAGVGLARQGWKVTIIEKEPPPWERVGESFDWEAPILLSQLGMDMKELHADDVLTTKPGVIIWSNTSHKSNEAWLLPPPSYMRMIGRDPDTYHGNRHELDTRLLELAKEAGCSLLVDRVKKVHMEEQAVSSVELENGTEIKSPFYIDASGRASLIVKTAGIPYVDQGQKMVSMWRRQRHHYDGRGTRVYLVDMGEHLVWLWNIHVAAETTDLGMVMPAALYRDLSKNGSEGNGTPTPKKSEDVYWDVIQRVELLKDFQDQSRISGPLHVCSFTKTVADRSSGDNWVAIGETAYVIDPISSAGVTVALRSGKFAASILDEALAKGDSVISPRNRKFYHKRLSLQVKFVNKALEDLYKYRQLGNKIGMPVYVRLLVLPQFHINWLSSNFPLRSRTGLTLLRMLGPILSTSVHWVVFMLRKVYRTK
jgi:flavin-dependent dehydrogenase